MKIIKICILVLFSVLVYNCVSMSDAYKEANIRIATHPLEVQGMTFVTGDTKQVGTGWSLYEVGIQAANYYAKAGYTNVIVLVELIQQGQTNFSGYGGSSPNVVRASVWR